MSNELRNTWHGLGEVGHIVLLAVLVAVFVIAAFSIWRNH